MQIYLDYSATTPPRPEVITKVQEVLTNSWGNPSSLHNWGARSATIIETARFQVADLINCSNPDGIIFTAGGTEADNLAIMGSARLYDFPQHLIISSVEHSAINEPVKQLEKRGWEVTRLPVNRRGRVNPQDLQAALKPNTVLVSVIYGQSEVGTLQPIEELGKICRQARVPLHTDAVQVVGRLPIDVTRLPVDLISMSSHKIYGMQGVGALYVRQGVNLKPLIGGGGQEFGLRSGTQAVAAIAGFGVAAKLAAAEMKEESDRLRSLRDRLFDLLSDHPCLIPTGDRLHRLPHHVSFCLDTTENSKCGGSTLIKQKAITGRTLVRELNLAGIGISSGSACHSGKLNASSILVAMGYSDELAKGAIRLTLGKETTVADIDWTALVLKQILAKLLYQ
jgi:cysteine desulfurase